MKRYEKYKPSGVDWIGEVPETWHISKMKYIAQYINGYAFKPADWTDVGLPIIRIQDLTGTNDHPNYFDGQIPKKYLIQNGDILISWAATLDSFVWNRGDAWLNQHIFKTIVNEQEVERNYFVWLSKVAMSNMNNENKHGIMMEHVTSDIFDNYCIPIPPLSEQKSIAAYLDARCGDIDKVVATQEKRIALLNEMKQSIITQAVTRGLNPDAKMKDSGVEWIGMVPEHWEVMPFKSKFKTDKGLNITKADLVDEGVPVISYGQIHSKQNDYVHTLDHLLRFIPEEMALADSKAKLEIGDIVFADTSEDVEGSGNAFYIEREGIYAGYHTVIAKSIERVDNKYFAYLFATPMWRSQIRSQVYGVKVFSITQQILKSTSLIAPPVEERKQIVEVLEEKCARIDKQIEKIQNQIELLREYKQSLITEVVTGKCCY